MGIKHFTKFSEKVWQIAPIDFIAEHLEKRLFLSTVLFQTPQTFPVGKTPEALAVKDLGNGNPDLVVANYADNTVGVLLGNGDGTFQREQTYPTGDLPTGVAIADLGNGHQDIIVTNYNSGTVTILLGYGNGTFQPPMTVTTGAGPIGVSVADLGNGHPDVITADYVANTVTVLFGNGNGTFGSSATFATGVGPDSIAAADLGNGNIDLVVGNYHDNDVSVLTGDGKGNFTPQFVLSTGADPFSVAVATLANGYPDIVVADNLSSTVSVFFGNGTGSFSAQAIYPTGPNPSSVVIADLGNGNPDLVIAASNSITVLRGNADGTFVPYLNLTAGTRPYSVVVADLGNGQPDILVSNSGDDTVSVLLNSTADSIVFTRDPENIVAGSTLAPIVLNVENSVGGLITNSNADVTLSIADGPDGATLVGSTTVSAINGVASFDGITIRVAGTYLLSALCDGAFVESAPFKVTSTAGSIGQLNPGYGVDGLTTGDLGFTSTDAVVEEGTQSILVGTIGAAPLEAFGVARYNADGSLDTTFGVNGVVTTRFGSTDDVPAAVIVSDGNIIVAGTAYMPGVSPGDGKFAVAEYNADGSPYPAFGDENGQAIIKLSNNGVISNDVLNAMVADSKRIYLGGSSNLSGKSGTDFALAAINFSGELDPTFGTDGVVLTDFGGGDDAINAIALRPNADVVAAGYGSIAGVKRIAMARVLPDGVLDKKFGIQGKTTAKLIGSQDTATSIVIQPKGQLLIGGSVASGSGDSLGSDFVIQRYTVAGNPDSSFGHGGTVITSFNQPSAVTQILLQPNGEIIASGKTTATVAGFISSQLQVALARYTSHGLLDTSFNGTGTTVIDLSTGTVISGTTTEIVATQVSSGLIGISDEFEAFSHAAQGVVASTPSGAILTAGSDGTTAVLGEVLTMGVDLIATLVSSLPLSEPKGFKATITVGIKENGNLLATGLVQIKLQLIADTQGNGAVNMAPVFQRISLRQGQSRSYHLSAIFPVQISTGDYYLQMTVVNMTVNEDLNPADNVATSPTAILLSAPAIKLTADQISITSMLRSGKPAIATLNLSNTGNLSAHGKVPIDLYLESQSDSAQKVQILSGLTTVSLSPSASHIYRLIFQLPKSVAAGSYRLIASIDPSNGLGPSDQSSSLLTDAVPVLVNA